MRGEGGVDRPGLEATACPRPAPGHATGRPSLRGPEATGEEGAAHTPSPDPTPLCRLCLAACPLTPVWPLSLGLHLGRPLRPSSAGVLEGRVGCRETGAQPEVAVDGALGPSVPLAHPSVLGSPTRCSGPGPLGVRGLVPQGSHRDSGSPLTLGLARAGSGWDESTRSVGRLSVSSALEGVTPPHGDWDGVLRPSRSVRRERCGVASRVLPVKKRPRCPFFQMLVQLG